MNVQEREENKKAMEVLRAGIAELNRHPATIQQREQEAAATLAKRTTAANKIKNLECDLQACGVIQRKIDGMVERLNVMDAERLAYQAAINSERSFLMQEKAGIVAGIGHEQKILYSTYSEKIDEAIEYFKKKLDWLRSPGRISSQRVGGARNIFTEKITTKTESNIAAVKDALKYCQNSIEELEKMKLEPALDTQKIEEMKKRIPDIGVYTESTGERPFPRINTDIRTTLPSDSEMAWKGKILLEKIDKLLKPAKKKFGREAKQQSHRPELYERR